MANEYVSKREQVRDFINETFWPSKTEDDAVVEVARNDLYIYTLNKYGASEGIVDAILERYAEGGFLKVSERKVERLTDRHPALSPQSVITEDSVRKP